MFLSWLSANILGIVSAVVGVYVTLVIRPRPKVRFWACADGDRFDVYRQGATSTSFYIRNVGNQPISDNQWRVPLSIEYGDANIDHIRVFDATREDIHVLPNLSTSEPSKAWIKIDCLDRGDVVKVHIKHSNATEAPQLHGELSGYHGPIARGFTIGQRSSAYLVTLFYLAVAYLQLSSIFWLRDSRPSVAGVAQGAVFLLASTFLPIALVAPTVMHRAQPVWLPGYQAVINLALAVLGVVAIVLASLDGMRLWFPQFAVYIVVALIAMWIAGAQVSVALSGQTREKATASPAVRIISWALFATIFAAFTIAGTSLNVLAAVALVCIIADTATCLDLHQLRRRTRTALGDPREIPLINLARPLEVACGSNHPQEPDSHLEEQARHDVVGADPGPGLI